MVDLNLEFTKGILFVRLTGILDVSNESEIEEKVFEIVKGGGIRFVVFNIKDLIVDEKVMLFERCNRMLNDNDGRMLVCGNKISAFNLDYVKDELSALKLLKV